MVLCNTAELETVVIKMRMIKVRKQTADFHKPLVLDINIKYTLDFLRDINNYSYLSNFYTCLTVLPLLLAEEAADERKEKVEGI